MVQVPSQDLTLVTDQEHNAFIESNDFLNMLVLGKSWLWDIFLLNLLEIITDHEASDAIFGTCEHNFHTSFLDEKNIKDESIVRVLLSNNIILDHLDLEIALLFPLVVLHAESGEDRVRHRVEGFNQVGRVLVLNRCRDNALDWG